MGALAKRVLLGSCLSRLLFLSLPRDDAGLRTVVSIGDVLRQSWCYIPGPYEGRPLWGRAVYTALTPVPVLSSVLSGDQSANLPCSRAQRVSSERFSQSLPPRNVAELGGSPPLRGSLEQLDRPSPAGPPFQGTELAALSTPETSLERLVPLSRLFGSVELLPNVSRWVTHTVEQGYVALLPQPFYGRAGSGNGTRSGHSPEGGDHRGGPCSRQESRFYSRTSLFRGKGLASVLDLS